VLAWSLFLFSDIFPSYLYKLFFPLLGMIFPPPSFPPPDAPSPHTVDLEMSWKLNTFFPFFAILSLDSLFKFVSPLKPLIDSAPSLPPTLRMFPLLVEVESAFFSPYLFLFFYPYVPLFSHPYFGLNSKTNATFSPPKAFLGSLSTFFLALSSASLPSRKRDWRCRVLEAHPPETLDSIVSPLSHLLIFFFYLKKRPFSLGSAP